MHGFSDKYLPEGRFPLVAAKSCFFLVVCDQAWRQRVHGTCMPSSRKRTRPITTMWGYTRDRKYSQHILQDDVDRICLRREQDREAQHHLDLETKQKSGWTDPLWDRCSPTHTKKKTGQTTTSHAQAPRQVFFTGWLSSPRRSSSYLTGWDPPTTEA